MINVYVANCTCTCTSIFFFISLLRTRTQNQFIEKNNDALHFSLEVLVTQSRNALVKQVFTTTGASGGANGGDSERQMSQKAGKLTFISVGSKFRSQLTTLMDKLRSTVSDASREGGGGGPVSNLGVEGISNIQ